MELGLERGDAAEEGRIQINGHLFFTCLRKVLNSYDEMPGNYSNKSILAVCPNNKVSYAIN